MLSILTRSDLYLSIPLSICALWASSLVCMCFVFMHRQRTDGYFHYRVKGYPGSYFALSGPWGHGKNMISYGFKYRRRLRLFDIRLRSTVAHTDTLQSNANIALLYHTLKSLGSFPVILLILMDSVVERECECL